MRDPRTATSHEQNTSTLQATFIIFTVGFNPTANRQILKWAGYMHWSADLQRKQKLNALAKKKSSYAVFTTIVTLVLY